MVCRVCGNNKTIKAHLIPRSMCTEVQAGKAHALTRSGNIFTTSQSGLWDIGILCAEHDGVLGRYEEAALKTFKGLRQQAANISIGTYDLPSADSKMLLLFFASILYKYAITRKELGKIELGPFLDPIQKFLFFEGPVPRFLDALLIRPCLYAGDTGVFAYRAPRLDRKFGRNMYRMMVGGVIAFVLVDNLPVNDPRNRGLWIKGLAMPRFTVQPAQQFEEFQIPRKQVHENSRLSAYLGKQEKSIKPT